MKKIICFVSTHPRCNKSIFETVLHSQTYLFLHMSVKENNKCLVSAQIKWKTSNHMFSSCIWLGSILKCETTWLCLSIKACRASRSYYLPFSCLALVFCTTILKKNSFNIKYSSWVINLQTRSAFLTTSPLLHLQRRNGICFLFQRACWVRA